MCYFAFIKHFRVICDAKCKLRLYWLQHYVWTFKRTLGIRVYHSYGPLLRVNTENIICIRNCIQINRWNVINKPSFILKLWFTWSCGILCIMTQKWNNQTPSSNTDQDVLGYTSEKLMILKIQALNTQKRRGIYTRFGHYRCFEKISLCATTVIRS